MTASIGKKSRSYGMMQLLYNIVFDAIPIITSQGKVITGYAGQGLTLKKKGLKLLVNS